MHSGEQCAWLGCQDEAPTLPETWPCLGCWPSTPGACWRCSNGRGTRTLQRTQTQAAGGQALRRPTGDGLLPHSDLFSGRVQLAATTPAICAELAARGAGPSARGSPSGLPTPVLFWLNWECSVVSRSHWCPGWML